MESFAYKQPNFIANGLNVCFYSQCAYPKMITPIGTQLLAGINRLAIKSFMFARCIMIV